MLTIALAVPASAEQFIKPNDRVVFLGDSITAQKLYTMYIEEYFAGSHPEMNVAFVNAGVGGDRSSAALNRVQNDVIAKNPTVVTICFGMNDAAYRSTVDMKGLETFKDGLTKLISMIRAQTKARVVLLTTTCVDETRNKNLKGYNLTLSRFVAETKRVAANEGVPVIDLFHPLRGALAIGQRADSTFTLVPDSVHPNEAGHQVMAQTILRAWGENPK